MRLATIEASNVAPQHWTRQDLPRVAVARFSLPYIDAEEALSTYPFQVIRVLETASHDLIHLAILGNLATCFGVQISDCLMIIRGEWREYVENVDGLFGGVEVDGSNGDGSPLQRGEESLWTRLVRYVKHVSVLSTP